MTLRYCEHNYPENSECPECALKITKEYNKFLEGVVIDILDGCSDWWNIQEQTGLSKERCIELSTLYNKLTTKKGNLK